MIRAAVLGGDVSRSRSPAIHNAAYAALGLDGQYEAISVDARGFRALVKRLRAEGYGYLNVTIPHKRAAAAVADARAPGVRGTAAANTLVFGRRGIRADNTDGDGLLAALADLGTQVRAGDLYVLVGAGGAAAGAVYALVSRGARVRIVARRPAAGRGLKAALPVRLQSRVEVAPWTGERLSASLGGAKAMISAVPAAAWDSATACEGLVGLPREAAVLEMAYGTTTPLAKAARRVVARYQDGIPMLVHQAARAIEIALGKKPPVQPLMLAARAGSR